MVKTAVDTYGGLDIALNNAGVMDGVFSGEPVDYQKQKPLVFASIHEATDEYWDNVFRTNVLGVFRSMRAQLRQMIAQKRSSKHALNGLTAMTAPTRRQIMAGSIAALGAAGAPAIAADDQDRAEWIALWLDYMRKERALEELPDDHTQEDEDRVNEARWAAGDFICDKPARSLAGLAVKLAYAVYWDTQAAWWDDITEFGFAGNNHTGAVSVYLDAVRVAGLPDDLWRCAWVDCGPIT